MLYAVDQCDNGPMDNAVDQWTNVILLYMCVKVTQDVLTSEKQGCVNSERLL